MCTDVYNWYVVYTRSRYEKKFDSLLKAKGITTFLPLRKTLKQRSDRKKWVEEPLFKSYIFIYVSKDKFELVRCTPGFVKFVSFDEQPAVLTQKEIDIVKNILSDYTEIDVTHDFIQGELVQIDGGSLQGIKGIVAKSKNKNRVAIRLENLNVNIIVEVPIAFLKRI